MSRDLLSLSNSHGFNVATAFRGVSGAGGTPATPRHSPHPDRIPPVLTDTTKDGAENGAKEKKKKSRRELTNLAGTNSKPPVSPITPIEYKAGEKVQARHLATVNKKIWTSSNHINKGVLARYRYYAGTVDQVNDNGTLKITYEDGDSEDEVFTVFVKHNA